MRRYFLHEYLKECKRQQLSDEESQEVIVSEEEVDQWLLECDNYITQSLMSYVTMTFMADMFLEKDITFVVSEFNRMYCTMQLN